MKNLSRISWVLVLGLALVVTACGQKSEEETAPAATPAASSGGAAKSGGAASKGGVASKAPAAPAAAARQPVVVAAGTELEDRKSVV